MFKHLIALFILVIIFTSSIGYALEVNDLYQAKIPVDSQASKERTVALKKAMQAVILKIGGHESAVQHDVMRNAIKKAKRYTTQYHYKEKANQLILVVNFNENRINQLFHQAKLPIWGSLRPQVLLWIIDEDGLHRTILSNSSNSVLPEKALSFSEQRALPILLPLMDLDDTNNMSLSDLWGRFAEPIRQASSRYYPEALVVIRVSNSSLLAYDDSALIANPDLDASNHYKQCGLLCKQEQTQKAYALDWTLFTAKEDVNQYKAASKQYQGTDKSVLLTLGLSDITDLIYQKYALSTSTHDQYVIEVANVKSLKHDSELVTFLNQLSAVQSVTLTQAKGQLRRFNLTLIGSPSALLASLKLHKGLKPVNRFIEPKIGSDEDQVPVFYWEQQ